MTQQYTHVERDLPPKTEGKDTEGSLADLHQRLLAQQQKIDKISRDISRLKSTIDSIISKLKQQ